jgi:hypothetical protein
MTNQQNQETSALNDTLGERFLPPTNRPDEWNKTRSRLGRVTAGRKALLIAWNQDETLTPQPVGIQPG